MTPVEVRVLLGISELNAIRSQWCALYDRSSSASPPLRFEWLTVWWRIYGPVYGATEGGLCIFTAWQDQRLVGAVPLYRRVEGRFLRHSRLQFLSTGEEEFEETCPEYMDMLAEPGMETVVVSALCKTLSAPAMSRWDDLVLTDLSQRSALLDAWPAENIRGCLVQTESRGSCFIADLEGGFDVYLGRLSGNSRQQCRRTLRDARQAGAVFQLADTTAEVDEWFDDLIDLHQARWREAGSVGCFSASRFTEFHVQLARQLVPRSAAVLARLAVGGQPMAVLYGFLSGRKFDFYQSGVRPDGCPSLARPGIAAHLLLMELLAARGINRYDFLRGDSDYKRRLTTQVQPLVSMRVTRRSLRTALWGASSITRRAFKRVARILGSAVITLYVSIACYRIATLGASISI